MMDCDTTGVEPDIALVKYKQLAGGGLFKIVNQTVPLALRRLGYGDEQVNEIVAHINRHDTIEGAPHLRDEHLSVFDCAFKPANGSRSIHYSAHLRMMGAAQPFLSGAISKTVNMPNEATHEEIMQVYIDAWKLGLKAVAVYRDGSKRIQPLNVSRTDLNKNDLVEISRDQLEAARRKPHRSRLPATRPSLTHKFSVARHEGYLNVGLYADGSPGELFITMAKEGSTVGGMMDAFATSVSLCLQYGVPLEDLVRKFSHQRFEPSGMTDNRDVPMAKSIVDYIFRWLGLKFLGKEYRQKHLPNRQENTKTPKKTKEINTTKTAAPEAVRDDVTSEPGRAGEGLDKDVRRPAGAPPTGGQSPDSGNGNRADGQAVKTALRLAATVVTRREVQRIDQQFLHYQEDAPACDVCGTITVRNGNCYKCYNCGSSLGCS
jgi:ribonucleoside-diphosphate reductase alpha chain